MILIVIKKSIGYSHFDSIAGSQGQMLCYSWPSASTDEIC